MQTEEKKVKQNKTENVVLERSVPSNELTYYLYNCMLIGFRNVVDPSPFILNEA